MVELFYFDCKVNFLYLVLLCYFNIFEYGINLFLFVVVVSVMNLLFLCKVFLNVLDLVGDLLKGIEGYVLKMLWCYYCLDCF